MKNIEIKCAICGSNQLEKLEEPKLVSFSTGDRKSFKKGNRNIIRVICNECGFVQFLQNDDYKNAIVKVFGDYDAMHDKVFDDKSSEWSNKLDCVCKSIRGGDLPIHGRMLDIGCGNGELFAWFNQIYPEWELYGCDVAEQFRENVLSRNNVKRFFKSLDELKGSDLKFDFITLHHMLCTVSSMSEILGAVWELLKDEGFVLVLDVNFEVHKYQVCCIENNIYFTQENIKNLMRRYCFEILDRDFKHEQKEVAVFARKAKKIGENQDNLYFQNKEIYNENMEYLNHVIDVTEKYVRDRKCLGIFGMNIAGIWLSEIITNHIEIQADQLLFFVDEDEDVFYREIGVNNFPIYSLDKMPKSATVFLPFPQYISDRIKSKYEKKYNSIEFVAFI